MKTFPVILLLCAASCLSAADLSSQDKETYYRNRITILEAQLQKAQLDLQISGNSGYMKVVSAVGDAQERSAAFVQQKAKDGCTVVEDAAHGLSCQAVAKEKEEKK